MKIFKNRMFAIALSVIMVLAGIYAGAYRGLSDIPKKAELAFKNGVKNDGYGIEYDIGRVNDQSANLLTIAKRNASVSRNKIDSFSGAFSALKAAETPAEKYAKLVALRESASELNDSVQESSAIAEDKTYSYRIIRDMESIWNVIIKNDYNNYAQELNNKLSQFPASWLKRLVGVSDVSYFR